jgi:predicted AAA+ superfamily ATPase
MIRRIINPLESDSFFIFGARGTGKSTFVQSQFFSSYDENQVWHIDLLNDDIFERYSRKPSLLESDFKELKQKPAWIFIDEVQKVPELLNHVHRMIENNKLKFILSGSSARKLKVVGANLLAGRAFMNFMYPMTYLELKTSFSLEDVLHWGSLPKTIGASTEQKMSYLRSYVLTYIKEEVLLEHFIKNLEPFRDFLEVAAQMNGKIINFSKIAKEVGSDDKTIKNYYSILEDTLLGFYLPAFHKSIRKGQSQHPKFYFFDLGIKRAIDRTYHDRFSPGTVAFGDAFEHLVVLEVFRLNSYLNKDFRISYFRTKEDKEIDLVLTRSRKTMAIEIKSRDKIDFDEVKKLKPLAKEIGATEIFYLSRDPHSTNIEGVHCLPWQKGIEVIFSLENSP